ncbi:MAG TPA: N-acetylmuramoyl-L-alanine amidase [Solirubrobacteraceae bacterium]|nr:N-acetylmuramoyl-L-alanine amidase [Solirubrobacteraceae bacterium]
MLRHAPLAVAAAVLVLVAGLTAVAALAATGEPETVPVKPMTGVVVAVDPGHNGGNGSHPSAINRQVPAGGFRKACDTTGAQTNDGKLTEAAFNLDVALRLRRALHAAGAKVVMTRTSNTGVGPCVDRRARIGNRAHADVAISIHADGGPPAGRGFHVIHPGRVRGYTEPIVVPSLALARLVRTRLDRAGLRRATYTGRDGLARRTDLGGLNLSTVPKVLVELGNMRNAGDAAQLEAPAWRQRVARALARSLQDFTTR